MKVTTSTIANEINKTLKTNLGYLYFFDNIVISEFNEGSHVSFQNASEVISCIEDHFGESKPFGFITNMINSYSIEPLDTLKFAMVFSNLVAYGAVCYNKAGKMSVIIQNGFCDNKIICFDDIYEAKDTLRKKVELIKNI